MVSDGGVRDVRRPGPRLRKRVYREAAEEVLAQSHPLECLRHKYVQGGTGTRVLGLG